MSFLAPLFILGGLAIVGPIVFHLIRRTTREATSFSSLMFLTASPPRVTRRSRLENLWLLLLRCLVLALLAIGFGRPFWRTQAENDANNAHEGKRTAILLDLSASMRRENLWDEARRKAQALLQKAEPGDQVALLAFDDRVRTIVDFDEWKKLPPEARAATAGARLATLSPGWGGTRLDAALTAAGELFLEPGAEHALPGEIVVISDLQEGARLEGLQAYEWPRGVRVTLDRVAAHQLANAGLQWLSESEEIEKNEEETPIRVRVSNATEAKREQFQVQWHDLAGAPAETGKLDVYVPAGQTRVIKAPKPPDRKSASLVLTGDEVDFDNTLYILPPQPLQTPLLFIGADAPEDPHASLYYLRRAFPKTHRQNVEIIAHASADAVPEFQLAQAQFAVIGDGASEKALDSAREFARSGKIVLVPLTSASAGITVAQLLGIPEFSTPEADIKDYALFAQIDFQHPFFRFFCRSTLQRFHEDSFLEVSQIGNGFASGCARPGALREWRSGHRAGSARQGERGDFRKQLASGGQPARAVLEIRSAPPDAPRTEQHAPGPEGPILCW